MHQLLINTSSSEIERKFKFRNVFFEETPLERIKFSTSAYFSGGRFCLNLACFDRAFPCMGKYFEDELLFSWEPISCYLKMHFTNFQVNEIN